MKPQYLSAIFLALLALVLLTTCKQRSVLATDSVHTGDEALVEQIRALGIHVKEIPNDHKSTHIITTYELYIPQPINHQDTSLGYFDQKVYLSHSSTHSPMVMYLSGYQASSNRYMSEPAQELRANQLHVEHRFFGDSKRGEVPYEHLTIAQSAADHHRIVTLLSSIYETPWVNTGISKGGQTTMYHRYFYPEDVDASVVYVAPLNQAREDQRIYDFLGSVGEKECRDKVLAYQIELLLNYDRCYNLFLEKSEAKGYSYGVTDAEAFELSIFEYGFAFWQWSANCDAIPSSSSSFEEKIDHLFLIDAPGFFTSKSMIDIFPFFYQSYTEMGMYGYQVGAFGGLTREYTEDLSNYRTFIPEEFNLEYDGSVHHDVLNWLDTEAEDMLFVYGEYDPWTATGYIPTGANNLYRYTIPEGNHASRLGHLSATEYQQFSDSLQIWIHN